MKNLFAILLLATAGMAAAQTTSNTNPAPMQTEVDIYAASAKPMTQGRTRAEVIAELLEARANGTMMQTEAETYAASAKPAIVPHVRAEVIAQLQEADRNGTMGQTEVDNYVVQTGKHVAK